MYKDGIGTEKDEQKVFEWFMKSLRKANEILHSLFQPN